MSNRYSTVAVIFLITLAHQACHKSPTAPGPPEAASSGTAVVGASAAKGGNPGKPGGGSAGVELQGGVVGASQAVPIQNDSSHELNLQGPHTNTINMASTHAMRSSVCSPQAGTPTEAEQEALLAKLLDATQERFRLVVVVDRSGSDHRLTLNFDDYDGPFEGVIVSIKDGVQVTEGPTDTFTFSGGDVLVFDRRGKPKDRVTMRCQNLDTVTVILDRGGS